MTFETLTVAAPTKRWSLPSGNCCEFELYSLGCLGVSVAAVPEPESRANQLRLPGHDSQSEPSIPTTTPLWDARAATASGENLTVDGGFVLWK